MFHQHEGHAGRARRRRIDLAVAHEERVFRGDRECFQQRVHHPRIGLAVRQRVAAAHAREVFDEPEAGENVAGDARRFVGAHRQRNAGGRQRLQRLGGPGEDSGPRGRVGLVVPHEAALGGGRIRRPAIPGGQRASHQQRHTISYHPPHFPDRQRVAAVACQHGVDGHRQVRGTVDQRAVEVENDECGRHVMPAVPGCPKYTSVRYGKTTLPSRS